MTGIFKHAMLAVVIAIIVFFGIALTFMLVSILIGSYIAMTVSMDRLAIATCEGSYCYYPKASTIAGISIVFAIVVGLSVFVTLLRHKGGGHSVLDSLRDELEEEFGKTEV